MSGRTVSRAEPRSTASSSVPERPRHPQGGKAKELRHPQGQREGQSLRPQGIPDRDSHHPQSGDATAATGRCCLAAVEHGAEDSAPDVQRARCAASGFARQQPPAPAPEPGVLRPLARALLAVAGEVHAARRDLPGADHRPSERALRMGNRGLRQGIHWGVRSVVRSPATLERPGSECASS